MDEALRKKIAATAQGLVIAVGAGHAVLTADIEAAARNIASQWKDVTAHWIQDEISKEIRKRGNPTTSSR